MIKFVSKILIFFVALLLLVAWGGFWVKKNLTRFSLASLVEVIKGREKIELTSEGKEILKQETNKVKDEVYKEATEHNPEGDVLPDELDDKIKQRLKEEAKKKIEE